MKRTRLYKTPTIFVLIVAVLSLLSCEDFLAETPQSQQSLNDIKDYQTLNIALTGAYSRLQNCYAPNCMAIGEGGTDITFTSKANVNALPVDTYILTTASGPSSNFWKNHFLLVRDANIVLDKAKELDSSVLTDIQRNQITAEALSLRAFAYFRLLQAYGELPIIDKALKLINSSEYAYPRKSINEVFHFIESDLRTAIDSEGLLPSKNGGRINTWAAKALLSKVYLYVGTSKHRNEVGTPEGGHRFDNGEPIAGNTKNLIPGYSEVKESDKDLYDKCDVLLTDIITKGNFDLTPNFYDPFVPMNKNTNVESIWEVQFSAAKGYGSEWSKQFGIYCGVNVQSFSAVGGMLIYQPTPGFYKYYNLGDMRREQNTPNKRITYFDDRTVSAVPDQFGYSIDIPFKNPANNASVKVAFSSDLKFDYKERLKYAVLQPALNTQSGTFKYGWGQSSDPTKWIYELMSYPQNNCPNNVIVVRYADILLMYAEIKMLLNGANPSRPQQTGHATQEAIDAVNKVIGRSIDPKGCTALLAEYTIRFNDHLNTIQTEFETAETDYNKDPKNANSFKNYIVKKLELADANYKVEHIAELVVNLYNINTFTYEMLIDERARELCFEFQRWFDLQRLGWLKYKVLQRKVNYETYPLPKIEEPKHYLYPIPLSDVELSTNPDFKKNNPGYGI